MPNIRYIAVTGLCGFSAGIGAFIGSKYEKFKLTNITSGNAETGYFLPKVSASTSIVNSSSSPAIINQAQPVNRVSEIMKYGFPSLDNIRSFDNFVLAYDRRNRNAHWVFEHLRPEHVTKNDTTSRSKSNFMDDNSVHQYFRATNDDFKKSGYDRGHLAAAANHRHSQKAMDQTFILSNISPQVGAGFNRGAWNDLEKYVRAIARKNRNVYCCTGPLYLPKRDVDGKLYVKYEVIGKNNVSVPTHFFKVVLIENNDGQYQLLSFVMPNQELPEKVNLKNFLVPLDSIERAAGLLIFDKFPRNRIHMINEKTM